MSFVYDKDFVESLKKTLDIGCLQPCVRERGTTRILLGEHRKRSFPDWPEREMDVKDDLHRELIIIAGNYHRQISEEETKNRVLHIARILEDHGVAKANVCVEMAKLPIPLSEQTIRHLLPSEYKMASKARVKPEEFAKPLSQPMFEQLAVTPSLESAEPSYPFPDCHCKDCPRLKQCW